MLLVAKEEALDAKLRWNRSGHHAMALDILERFEHPRDVTIRLFGAPPIAGVAIDVVEAMGCRLLDAYASHVSSGSVTRDDVSRSQRPIGRLRSRVGMGQFSF